jgi:hypothetical protein
MVASLADPCQYQESSSVLRSGLFYSSTGFIISSTQDIEAYLISFTMAMNILIVYAGAAVAFIFGITFYLIAFSDRRSILGTPNIPAEKGVLTSYGSTTIHATVDEVFAALTNFKEYSEWSSIKNHTWEDATEDGVPRVGSNGKFEVRLLENFWRCL